MLTETQLVKEFTTLAERTYPEVGDLLQHCLIKLVTAHWGQPAKRLDYIAIYCPEALLSKVAAHQAAFKHISRYMGLAAPICVNGTRLLRDPMSQLKHSAPRFWLELQWLSSTRSADH